MIFAVVNGRNRADNVRYSVELGEIGIFRFGRGFYVFLTILGIS